MGDNDLEIHIPAGPSWPPNPRTERIKMWANIVSTAAALIIAIAAAIKPPDGGASKQVYEEHNRQLQVVYDEEVRQHQDIMALRKYIDDYLRSATLVGPNDKGVTQPHNPNAPVVLIPIDKSKIRTLPGPDAQPVLILPAGDPPPMPDMHPVPEPLQFTDFQKLADQAAAEKALADKKAGK